MNLSAFFAGLLFAAGLAIGGMTQPSKVVGFLDFAGRWDPSLIFVMGGAILVHAPLAAWIRRRRSAPIFHERFELPTRQDFTLPLVVGSALFGIGWGLGGYCPGPALTALPSLSPEALTFTATMTLGVLAHRLTPSK